MIQLFRLTDQQLDDSDGEGSPRCGDHSGLWEDLREQDYKLAEGEADVG